MSNTEKDKNTIIKYYYVNGSFEYISVYDLKRKHLKEDKQIIGCLTAIIIPFVIGIIISLIFLLCS